MFAALALAAAAACLATPASGQTTCPAGQFLSTQPAHNSSAGLLIDARTVCTACLPGTFSPVADESTSCRDHNTCSSTGVRTAGSEINDAICGPDLCHAGMYYTARSAVQASRCTDCPHGTFSSSMGKSQSCASHKKCEGFGVMTAGSATKDAVCKPDKQPDQKPPCENPIHVATQATAEEVFYWRPDGSDEWEGPYPVGSVAPTAGWYCSTTDSVREPSYECTTGAAFPAARQVDYHCTCAARDPSCTDAADNDDQAMCEARGFAWEARSCGTFAGYLEAIDAQGEDGQWYNATDGIIFTLESACCKVQGGHQDRCEVSPPPAHVSFLWPSTVRLARRVLIAQPPTCMYAPHCRAYPTRPNVTSRT